MVPLLESITAQNNHLGDNFGRLMEGQICMKKDGVSHGLGTVGSVDFGNTMQRQDSLAKWINDIVADSPESVDEHSYEASVVTSHGSFVSPAAATREGSALKQIFSITDISPQWASSTEETKVSVIRTCIF